MYVIEVKSLSKIYRMYDHPRDRLKEIIFRKVKHVPFAALKDITFGVERGETFGIIGENGAGKSTLLKVLAGTLSPTHGNVVVRGRRAALLELGAGFHPEFTGEENIFLNAALLGLSKREIEKRFDDIVSFSELGEFIYRPVRIYSSGMYIRLAFSIATSVDPEILVVDEALSVGDQYFQKKSIDRLMGFRNAGKTIVFCTHNMYQIKQLCKKAMWLKNGEVAAMGEVERVVAAYETYQMGREGGIEPAESTAQEHDEHYGNEIRIKDVQIIDASGHPIDRISSFEDLHIRFTMEGIARSASCHLAIVIARSDRINCFLTGTHLDKMNSIDMKRGDVRTVSLKISRLPLLAGEYVLCAYITDEHGIRVYDLAEYFCPFFVSYGGGEMGISYMDHEWNVEE